MKFLKSDCEKVWFFDVGISDGALKAGLACFLPSCGEEVVVTLKEVKQRLQVPKEARDKVMPIKICNARLLMLF